MSGSHETKVVPANIEAEQALLSTILSNNSVLDRVSKFLEDKHFHEPIHREMYRVCVDMIQSGRGVDPITIKPYLPVNDAIADGVTVGDYLIQLVTNSMPTLHAVDYGYAIHEMWIRRQAIGIFEGIAETAYSLDPGADILTAVGDAEERISQLRAEQVRGGPQKKVGAAYIDRLSESVKRGFVRGVPLPLPEMGEVMSEPNLEAGNLYGLLSSSGEGKTSLTLQVIRHALEQGHPTLFMSYDQSSDQSMMQMVAQKYGIEFRRQRSGDLSEKEFGTAMSFADWIDGAPYEFIKCTDHTAHQLLGFARRFRKMHPSDKPALVVVDHIGSVKPEDRRADEGTKAKEINKVFKAGAEVTDAAWFVLNQRNSRGMSRDNPRPISADLFGGDPAKQGYDAIMYLYRPEKFMKERQETAASEADWAKIRRVFTGKTEGVAELGALKVRFGNPNIKRSVEFEAKFTRYRSEEMPAQEGLI